MKDNVFHRIKTYPSNFPSALWSKRKQKTKITRRSIEKKKQTITFNNLPPTISSRWNRARRTFPHFRRTSLSIVSRGILNGSRRSSMPCLKVSQVELTLINVKRRGSREQMTSVPCTVRSIVSVTVYRGTGYCQKSVENSRRKQGGKADRSYGSRDSHGTQTRQFLTCNWRGMLHEEFAPASRSRTESLLPYVPGTLGQLVTLSLSLPISPSLFLTYTLTDHSASLLSSSLSRTSFLRSAGLGLSCLSSSVFFADINTRPSSVLLPLFPYYAFSTLFILLLRLRGSSSLFGSFSSFF